MNLCTCETCRKETTYIDSLPEKNLFYTVRFAIYYQGLENIPIQDFIEMAVLIS